MIAFAFVPIVVALILNVARKSKYRLWSLCFTMAATIVGGVGAYILSKSTIYDSGFIISLVFAGASFLLALMAIALSLASSPEKPAQQPKVSGVTAILVLVLSTIGAYLGLILLFKYLYR